VSYKFHIDEWLPRFPLTPEYGRFSGKQVTGPGGICNNHQLRAEIQGEFSWGRAVPVDIFIMADGEPKDRWVTKIGGLPYRSVGAKWPEAESGRPLTFIAQFNFTNSKDITGELPGDLLLVFGDNSGGPFDEIQFEWQGVDVPDLIAPADVPARPLKISPCYGHIFRTVSFPDAERTTPFQVEKYPKCRGLEVWSSFFIPQYQATQIGEAPYFIQEGDDQLPGRMLCTISSPGPDQHGPFPWVNRAEPLMPPDKWNFNDDYLAIGDSGCIYISIEADGSLHYGESCY
jgi:hypothetical protein